MKKTFLVSFAGLFLMGSALFAPPAEAQELPHAAYTLPARSDSQKPQSTPKADVEMPEAVTFLNMAGEEMAKYHRAHKTYAALWHQFGFDYAYPTYHVTDPGLRATPGDKNRWRPRGSHFTYVIASATRDSFLIKALNDKGKTAYELKQGMVYPKAIGVSTNHTKSGKLAGGKRDDGDVGGVE